MNNKNVDLSKICHFPWTHVGLGWNKFSVCCVASPEDYFLEIMGGGAQIFVETFLIITIILM